MQRTIIETTVSARKGDAQPVKLHLYEKVKYPRPATSYRHHWEGIDYQNPGVSRSYGVVVLRPDFDPALHPLDNRNAYAGYRDAPTALEYRREPIGELMGEVRDNYSQYVFWQPAYGTSITDSARAWLRDQLDATVIEGIARHRDKLHAEATTKLAESFADNLKSMRETLERLDADASEYLRKFA